MFATLVSVPNVEGKLIIIPREPYYSIHVEKACLPSQASTFDHIQHNFVFMVSHNDSESTEETPRIDWFRLELERELKGRDKALMF